MSMERTDSIYLRALEPEDVNFMLLVENDQQNWKVSETKAPFSRFLIEEYIKTSQDVFANKQVRFVIMHENHRAGFIDLFDIDFTHLRAGVGILVVDQFRGKGIAKEALVLLCDYANELNLKQLYCSIREDNDKSIKLFTATGYQQMATKRNWRKVKDRWFDEYDYQKMLE